MARPCCVSDREERRTMSATMTRRIPAMRRPGLVAKTFLLTPAEEEAIRRLSFEQQRTQRELVSEALRLLIDKYQCAVASEMEGSALNGNAVSGQLTARGARWPGR